MRVSVVIPAYRAEATIGRTLDSVLAQTYPAHEIIVVDDGSPDNQVAVIRQRACERLILLQQPNGRTARARNTGLERATGEAIAFLDADDYWEPSKLEEQVAIFARHPEVGMVAGVSYSELPGQARSVSQPDRRTLREYDRVLRVRRAGRVRIAARTWTGMVMIRRQALGEARFVSGLEPAEDRDLWLRMLCHPVYLGSKPLATAVLEPGSISRGSLDVDCQSMLQVIQRNREALGIWGYRLWTSYTLFRWSALDPRQAPSFRRLARSCLLWPLPYSGYLPAARLVRVKRWGVLLRQLLSNAS